MRRNIRVSIKIAWTLTCVCRRKYTVRAGTVIRCACGRTWRF
jgi:hypothetical protein